MTFFGTTRTDLKEIDCRTKHKPLYNRTFRSKTAEFSLNLANIFDIVDSLEGYVNREHYKASEQALRPENSASLVYEGNKLELLAGTYDPSVLLKRSPVGLKMVTLAEVLVLQKKFLMKIYEQTGLVVDPRDLLGIAKKYKI